MFDCEHMRGLPCQNLILPFVTWKPLAALRPLWVGLRSRPTIQSVASDALINDLIVVTRNSAHYVRAGARRVGVTAHCSTSM